MVDKNAEIYSILNSIASTYYQYPQILVESNFNNTPIPDDFFPAISYFDSDHSAEAYQDNINTIDFVEYTIDLWERINPQTGEFIQNQFNVDQAMRAAGYVRTTFVNQYEEDTKIYHITLKYRKIEEEPS